MLTREQFKEVMTEVVELSKIENEVDDALKRLSPDFMGFSLEKPLATIVKTLTFAMKDKSEWIAYWIWELELGTKAKKNTVKNKKGNSIPIKTIENLYDIITNKRL